MKNIMVDRISRRIEELGISVFEASLKAGLGRTFIYDFMEGKKDSIRHKNLAKIAEALNTTPEFLSGLSEAQTLPIFSKKVATLPQAVSTIPVRRRIEWGVWSEADRKAPEGLSVASDPRFPASDQLAFQVIGNHWQNLGIGDSSIVIAVTDIPYRDGDLLVVERTKSDGTSETAIGTMSRGQITYPLLDLTKRAEVTENILGVIIAEIRIFGEPTRPSI